MSEFIRVVPLMAVYDGFDQSRPSSYEGFQPAEEHLVFEHGLVTDKLGVSWFARPGNMPDTVHYLQRKNAAPLMDYVSTIAGGDASYGVLGVLDPELSELTREKTFSGDAKRAKIQSLLVYCRPLMKGHNLTAEGKTARQDRPRVEEHNKPLRASGSLVINHSGILTPLCPDGPQEKFVDVEYGFRDFMVVSPITINANGAVIFERPETNDTIEKALAQLDAERDAYFARMHETRAPRQADDRVEIPDEAPKEAPQLYGRARRRAHLRGLKTNL